MIIVGIDPGVNGAVAILDTYRFKEVQALPLTHNTLSDVYLFLSEIRGGVPYALADKHYGYESDISDQARAKHVSTLRKGMHIVQSNLPSRALAKGEDHDDNTMEMWLEEPGQIVVNSRTTREDGKRDNTGALLAGMKASRSLGRSVGQWEGIAAGLNISVNLVPPKVWQGRLKCLTRGDKNISKKCAYTVFPYLTDKSGRTTITHDIADSLLIATYGYLQYADPKYYTSSLRRQLSGVPQ
jgi:hypothetical protein